MALDTDFQDKKKSAIRKKPAYEEADSRRGRNTPEPEETGGLMALQDQVGNHVVQAMLAQRQAEEPFELDEATAGQIDRERGGGQALDSQVQEQMGRTMGQDLSEVKVHTSPEADALSQALGARAFTTGQDIFFRQGAYEPHSGAGRELLAHELTHVVQQSSGAVSGGQGAMTVNAPNDAYEQEADRVAKAVTEPGSAVPQATEAGGMIARQEADEDEEDLVQMQAEEEEALEEAALPETAEELPVIEAEETPAEIPVAEEEVDEALLA